MFNLPAVWRDLEGVSSLVGPGLYALILVGMNLLVPSVSSLVELGWLSLCTLFFYEHVWESRR